MTAGPQRPGLHAGLLGGSLALAGCTLLSGCAAPAGVTVDAAATGSPSGSTGAATGTPTGTPTGTRARKPSGEPTGTPAADPGPVQVSGAAFRFTLPTGGYRQDPDQVTDTGATVRRWRLPLDAAGTACVVVAGEQPDYRGSFPAVQLAAFGAGRGRGSEVLVNEVADPPDGAVAAVRQELRFVLRRADGGTAPARLYARQFLTPGRTLVSLNAAAPDAAAGRCRPEALAASLLPTGREYTAPTATTPTATGATATATGATATAATATASTDPSPSDPGGSSTGGTP